jgi:UDP-N-acetylmuramoyl-tripeptide--D-alanyl-D-alanine ligase
MIWSAIQLEQALGVKVNPGLQTEIVQFNSKDILKGDIFIALPGNVDGHNYAQDAIERGASCVIVSKHVENIPLEKVIFVNNTRKALQQLALYKRTKSKAKFIAITGSVGKTSTKEALNIMLDNFGKTFASRGNFNNDLGVPINLASMADDVDYAIFEVGMNHAGEIRELTKIIKPDIAMITLVSAAHLEFFKSIEEIADAKSEIIEGLVENGVAVVNINSSTFQRIIDNFKKFEVRNIITFGNNKNANAKLEIHKNSTEGSYFKFNINSFEVEVSTPQSIPRHQAENFTGCLSVVLQLKLDILAAAKSLSKFNSGVGRGKIVNASEGKKNYKIICDYYNANPASLKASLSYLKEINHSNKVVIIGDMLELGKDSPKFHSDIVPYIVSSGATKILLVGSLVKFIDEFLPKNLYTRQFENVEMLIGELENILDDNELILIKGSKGIKLNKVLEYFDIIEEIN